MILLLAATSGYSAYKLDLRTLTDRRPRGYPVGHFRPDATSPSKLNSGDEPARQRSGLPISGVETRLKNEDKLIKGVPKLIDLN